MEPDATTETSAATITTLAHACGFGPEAAARAVATAGALPLVSFSGWLLSGKDTVALAVYRKLGVSYRHLSLAGPMREELDAVIGTLRCATSVEAAGEEIAATLAMRPDEARALCELVLEGQPLAEAYEHLQVLDAYQRTAGVRRALQHLATEIRRAADPTYWVTQAQRHAVVELAQGRAFTFTDVRTPDEVAGLQALGAVVVRLEISRATQLARLEDRDGLAADPAALYHSSETALDGFTGFDVVLDNERPLEAVVAEVLARVTSAP